MQNFMLWKKLAKNKVNFQFDVLFEDFYLKPYFNKQQKSDGGFMGYAMTGQICAM